MVHTVRTELLTHPEVRLPVFSSRAIGSAAGHWESRVVRSNSPVTARPRV